MGAIFWIIVGAMTGFVCSKLVYKQPEGLLRDVLVGVLGGLVGGFIYHRLGYSGPQGLTPGSVIIAVSSAVLLVTAYRVTGGRKRPTPA